MLFKVSEIVNTVTETSAQGQPPNETRTKTVRLDAELDPAHPLVKAALVIEGVPADDTTLAMGNRFDVDMRPEQPPAAPRASPPTATPPPPPAPPSAAQQPTPNNAPTPPAGGPPK